ncbi:MAG: BrnA antitoxin family protein [Gemmobacter sp.]
MPRPPAPKPAAHYHYLAETLRDLEGALRHGLAGSAFVPEEWEAVAQGVPEPGKEKLTLRVDADVIRFFRLMGRGYLTQMNAVLRAFMHARLAGVVRGPEAVDYAPTPMERYVIEGRSVIEAMARRNMVAARGGETGAADLVIARRLAALEELADEAGVPEEDRMRG